MGDDTWVAYGLVWMEGKQERREICDAAERNALAYVLNLTVASAENHEFWKSTDEFRFGPGVLGIAEETTPRGESNRPTSVDVDVEVWSAGHDADRKRLYRVLTVTMQSPTARKWTVAGCSISGEGDVGVFEPPKVWFLQMLRYYLIGLGLPFVIAGMIYACAPRLVAGLFSLCSRLVMVASPVFGVYYAYWLTGSVGGAIAGFLASLLTGALVYFLFAHFFVASEKD